MIASEEAAGYHTYGFLHAKAHSYKKITYQDLYPGIDVEYTFLQLQKQDLNIHL